MGYVEESGETRVVEPGLHRFVTARNALADAEASTSITLDRRVLPA